jgi:DNA ligase-1
MDDEQEALGRLPGSPRWCVHPQQQATPARVSLLFEVVTKSGGEGIMLRYRWSPWRAKRVSELLKLKAEHDTEGSIIGYQAGKGKHLGRLGSLVVRCDELPKKPTLSVGGFTDDERYLDSHEAIQWALNNPGAAMPFDMGRFPRGTKVTFKYRGLSAAGVPLEARYWRKYHE